MNQVLKSKTKNIEDIFALAPMQEGMLAHYLKAPHDHRYFEQLCLKLVGEIDRERFECAWNVVAANNEMLRTLFRWDKVREPVQIVLKKHTIKPRYFDFSGKSANDALEEFKLSDKREKFDLRQVPFRVTLGKTGESKYTMLISHHHILLDGWSSGIILKEFLQAYDDLSRHKNPVRPHKEKYKAFVRYLLCQDTARQADFWRHYLKDFPARALESSRRSGKRESREVAHYRLRLTGSQVSEMERFVRQHKITVAALLYSAWGMLLQTYFDCRDLIFDTTVSGRSAKIKGIEDMVGLLINTLPMRIQTHDRESILDLLYRTHSHLQRRQEFECTSLKIIDESLTGVNRSGLFDSVVVIENYPLEQRYLQHNEILKLESYAIEEETHHDLTVIITLAEYIDLALTYDTGLLCRQGITRMTEHFLKVLAGILDCPQQKVGEREIVSPQEGEKIRGDLNRRRRLIFEEKAPGYTPPHSELEQGLVDIWSELLRLAKDKIGIDDDFFDFGGHSLKVSMLISAVHKRFHMKLPFAEVFNRRSIRELASYIVEAAEDRYRPLRCTEKREYYPVSSAQRRFYMLHQLQPQSKAYNVTALLKIEGRLDQDRLSYAFKNLIRRHQSLRTSFWQIAGNPVQKTAAEVEFEIECPGPGQKQQLEEIVEAFVRPFDLEASPLLRVGLISTGETGHILLVDMHHIITDAVSMDLFIKEFSALYEGSPLAAVKHQYRDFCQWQSQRLISGELKESEAFWQRQLAGELPVLNIPTDFKRPPVQSLDGERIFFKLERDLYSRLIELARGTGTTMFMVLLSALNVLLFQYTNQADLLVGTTVAGRDHADLAHIIGLLIETVVIRNRLDGNMSFKRFLRHVRMNALQAFQHQAYPYGELLRKIGGDEGRGNLDLSQNPLFNVMLIVQNVEMAGIEWADLKFIPLNYYSRVAKVDFTLEAVETAGELRFHLEYCIRLFKQETMERLAGHFMNILGSVVENPLKPLNEIDLLNPGERREILAEFSAGSPKADGCAEERFVDELFVRQAAKTPSRMALMYEDKDSLDNLQVTYGELYRQIDKLAKIIKDL